MQQHSRRSIRLRDYDYTQNGAYFVTLCTHRRAWWFGDVVGGEMRLNAWGEVVREEWERTAVVRPSIDLDAFVVMPNHIHGIIVMTQSKKPGMGGSATPRATQRVAPTGPASGSLGAIIGQFKSMVTKRLMRLPNPPDDRLWQRNYHEHIIRNQTELDILRAYVMNNPGVWAADSLYGPEIL